jgi:hypothetical protein
MKKKPQNPVFLRPHATATVHVGQLNDSRGPEKCQPESIPMKYLAIFPEDSIMTWRRGSVAV